MLELVDQSPVDQSMPARPAAHRRSPILISLSAIEVERPADLILRQLRDLVGSGALKPGDRLPAERDLAAQFGVGRSHVRDALRRLEFYGILQTLPQSGTVVSQLGVPALERMISSVLCLDRDDISALSETRVALEVETATRAAERATRADVRAILQAEKAFRTRALAGDPALQEDLALHLAIAQAAHNAVLASLVGLITPNILRLNGEHKTCSRTRLPVVADEHRRVVAAIETRDPVAAARAMADHARQSHDEHFRKTAAKTGRAVRTGTNGGATLARP
jgi:GntR family transcriptional repressor for pyruvate dehydrogenase complex